MKISELKNIISELLVESFETEATAQEYHQISPVLSVEAYQWLLIWTWAAPRELPPDEIIQELAQLRPPSSQILYRYIPIKGINLEPSKTLVSYNTTIEQAFDSFGDDIDFYLRVSDVMPENILIQMNRIPGIKQMRDLLEDEVIVFNKYPHS